LERDSLPDPAQGVHLRLHQIFAVGIGNGLEFYDFLTFSFFSIQIGHSFFPESQTSHGLLFTLATFGIGFLTRPLGGILIGGYGDRAGRRAAMVLSFALMGVASLGLALTPSFARIGAAAPLLLLLFRLLQGFALGGEVGPSTAYLVEAAPPERRGLYVSIQASTQDLAICAAGIVGFVLSSAMSPAALDQWGWRLAFLLGVTIVPLGLWMRRSLPETMPAPDAAAPRAAGPRVPVRLVVLGLFMLGAATICGYVLSYMTTYAQDSLGMSPNLAFGATIVVGFAEASAALASGALSDRFGRRPVTLAAFAVLLVLAVPTFAVMNRAPGVAMVYASMALVSLLVDLATIPIQVCLAESLPAAIRSGTFATLYAVAIACFGGSTQFILKWLIDVSGSSLAPAWYMTGAVVIGSCATLMVRESAPRKVAAMAGRPYGQDAAG
jgi:MHS family citrate/tricarballylate:H+ symporter-like MFS transporter